ncbi:MAG: hypothetical protein CL467_05215 [Acidimicrobiaceae bacterium]|nr:hypothetical protein [Acidimicrobiaceae bacterium]|tara:strand:- start:4945 stop:5628 length:684 start_codon:yes stop_codon:yes gene_type:complete
MVAYTTELPLRSELDAAHAEAMAHFSNPGTWWTGSERLAMVDEVRRARTFKQLPPWQVPVKQVSSIDGAHTLPAAAVDAVWRLTNHPGTLTSDWYQSIAERGLQPLAYVELVSLVSQANCVDRFADALCLERMPLPEPIAGEPSREVPEGVEVRLHWVPTDDVGGPNVWRALSGVPAELAARSRLSTPHYLEGKAVFGDVVSDRFSLQRVQIELIAGRTSKLNECFY